MGARKACMLTSSEGELRGSMRAMAACVRGVHHDLPTPSHSAYECAAPARGRVGVATPPMVHVAASLRCNGNVRRAAQGGDARFIG